MNEYRGVNMMNKPKTLGLSLAVALLLVSAATAAHPMTEKYIPVGAYPGWDRGLVRGTVESVDQANKTIVVRTSSGLISTILGPATKIWLDRSVRQEATLDGALGDLRSGQQVELRREGDYGQWVKVKVGP